ILLSFVISKSYGRFLGSRWVVIDFFVVWCILTVIVLYFGIVTQEEGGLDAILVGRDSHWDAEKRPGGKHWTFTHSIGGGSR
ncbi:MAG: hypothetical protein WEC84_01180, partial [Candidatus Andersenbacteria bacterium]